MPSLPSSIPATHAAITVSSPRAPLAQTSFPTHAPLPSEVLVRVTWTASSPVDLHHADGGLLIDDESPGRFVLGCTFGGTVVALGEGEEGGRLAVGDKVFGFVQDGDKKEAGYQEYATVPVWRASKLPSGWEMREAVTVPGNLVTAMHAAVEDLGLELVWPKPDGWTPPEAEEPILVWGAASGVGMYALQVLRHWGYRNLVAVASSKHHEMLKELGARVCFDYRRESVVEEVLGYVGGNVPGAHQGPRVPYILDCIGSVEGTLRPLAKIAESGSKVAIMLPVIKVHASSEQVPELEMDVNRALPNEWAEGVELKGTRTFFYMKNEFFKNYLQPEIVPALLEQGVIQPNKTRVVEGGTLLERAQNALDLLRDQAVSGEKLVWRVAEEDD